MIHESEQQPQPIEPAWREPAPNQFGLRGMFLLTTSLCVICAAASWAGLHNPVHLFGVFCIVLFCALTIGLIELVRRVRGEPGDLPPYIAHARRLGVPRLDNLRVSKPPQSLPIGENPFREVPEALPREDDSGELKQPL